MTVVIECDHMLHALNRPMRYANKDQQESHAVARKPHVGCRWKNRDVSNFTAASRGSPCNSITSLFGFCTDGSIQLDWSFSIHRNLSLTWGHIGDVI